MNIERDAYAKRLEYLTIDVLPDCDFKEMKIKKLLEEQHIILSDFNETITKLITDYWYDVLQELI